MLFLITMRPAVFDHLDYKEFLKAWLESADSTWGSVTKLAEAAGCQRSYLSQVLHGNAHLTPDHAHGLSEFWSFSLAEKEFFLLLVEKARAASLSYREYLETKLTALKREQENLSKRLNKAPVEEASQDQLYFSSWHWSALHVLVSIPEFQTTKAISERLQIPRAIAQSCLETLTQLGLVRFEMGHWSFASGNRHLPKTSPLIGMHHNNWRQRAVLHAQSQPEEGLHYTVVQSMDARAFEKIKGELLKLIENANKTATPSPSEKLVCMTCDLFEA